MRPRTKRRCVSRCVEDQRVRGFTGDSGCSVDARWDTWKAARELGAPSNLPNGGLEGSSLRLAAVSCVNGTNSEATGWAQWS